MPFVASKASTSIPLQPQPSTLLTQAPLSPDASPPQLLGVSHLFPWCCLCSVFKTLFTYLLIIWLCWVFIA